MDQPISAVAHTSEVGNERDVRSIEAIALQFTPAALQAPRVAHADPGFAAKETVPTVAEVAQSLAALRSAGGQ
jgi:hypothetical protein